MAELTLSAVGLATTLFTSVLQCYGILRTAQGLSRDAPIAYWKLRIQEIRLRAWGRFCGVEQGTFDEFLEKEDLVEVVCGILHQLQAMLQDSARLKEKYGLEGPAMMTGDGQDTVTAVPGGRESEPTPGIVRRSTWSEKLKWALTDKAKFGDLITELKELNDGLFLFLRLRDLELVNGSVQSGLLRATDHLQDVSNLSLACESNVRGANSSTIGQVQRRTQPYKDLLTAAKSKRMIMEQSRREIVPSGIAAPGGTLSSLETSPSLVQGFLTRTPSSLRVLGEFEGQAVLLEWKDVDKTSTFGYLIAQRIENLAQLLSTEAPKPADFRVLDCLGYFFDGPQSRFGYIFQLPPEYAPRPPLTLHDAMSRSGQQDTILNLGERFVIAQALASSMLRLHDCGWIHTAFRSDSVLFFYQNSNDLVIHKPYIAGFGYSKPSDPTESTVEFSKSNVEHDLYRHPDIILARADPSQSHRVRHGQLSDLYSLGIVLLEIGLWERIGNLWKPKYSYQEFLQKLSRAYVPKLGPKMGVIYRDVVRDLLSAGVGTPSTAGETSTSPGLTGEPSGTQGEADGHGGGPEMDGWDIVTRLGRCNA